MKLEAEYDTAPDGGRDRATVVHRPDDRALVDRLHGIRMDEVEVRLVGNTREPRVRPHDPHLIPPGMRHAHVAAEASHAPAAQAEARCPRVFLALVEEKL